MPEQLEAIYLTSEDLAERYKAGLGTIREWRLKGTGPRATKLGPQLVRYHIEDVLAWERERQEASA